MVLSAPQQQTADRDNSSMEQQYGCLVISHHPRPPLRYEDIHDEKYPAFMGILERFKLRFGGFILEHKPSPRQTRDTSVTQHTITECKT